MMSMMLFFYKKMINMTAICLKMLDYYIVKVAQISVCPLLCSAKEVKIKNYKINF